MEARSSTNGEDSSQVQTKEVANDGPVPQLFTSVPALNEATSYLAQTTSYITDCFSNPSIECTTRDSGYSVIHQQEVVELHSEKTWGSVDGHHQSSSQKQSGYFSSSATAICAPPMPRELTRISVSDQSPDSRPLVASTSKNTNSIFKSLIERVQRTVRGSVDDIGWLLRDPEMPPVQDGTERFMEFLDHIRLSPPWAGLFSNHGPLYFVDTKIKLTKMGLTCHIAKIHSEASVETNASKIKENIEELYAGSSHRVLLLGHSKGGVDAAAALSLYWSDLKDKVAGLVLAQSPYGGSPIASDILREGQLGDYVNLRKLMEILLCKVIKGDMRALEDLTYERRKDFLKKHHLPKELPVVSFHTEAGISAAVIATLSQVAHAELPKPLSIGEPAKLPVVMPLGAAMAACARILEVRYKEKSDGLVTCRDAEVPGSIVVRPKRKLDHAWMVYNPLTDDPLQADAAQVCEALLTLLVEAGQKRNQELATKDE